MTLEPIGYVESPYERLENMPIQPKGAASAEGTIIIDPSLAEGLKDLEGFSHLYIIYHFHKALRTELTVTPFMDTEKRGVFATRSPLRPSHLGLSVVEMITVEGNRVRIRGVDMLEGTPVLDIKPYIEKFDRVDESRSGWMDKDEYEIASARSDGRFI